VTDANGTLQEKYLQLPGGVLLTIRPAQTGAANQVFSIPNIHGDTMATTDANGTATSTFTYDPFGNAVSGGSPNNTANAASFGWEGQHEKDTEAGFTLMPTEMGARVYISACELKIAGHSRQYLVYCAQH